MAFPEIQEKYGDTATAQIDVYMNTTSSDTFGIQIDTVDGISMGSGNSINFTLKIDAVQHPSKTIVNACTFSFNIIANFNISLTQTQGDFIVWPRVVTHWTNNTKILTDNVDLYSRNYDEFFNSLLGTFTTDFNIKYERGLQLSKLASPYGPIFLALALVTEDTVLTPFKIDKFIYGGFSIGKQANYSEYLNEVIPLILKLLFKQDTMSDFHQFL